MFSFKKISEVLKDEPRFRIKQALKAVYQQAAESWDEVTVLSKDLRERMNNECSLEIKADVLRSRDDDTIKVLFDFSGDKVESVLMRHKDRNTVCVSSQVGCALGCSFCLTGTMGVGRDLSADEIVTQVLFFNRILKKDKVNSKGREGGAGQEERVTNVVFMGMGEPFLNYDNVMTAIRKLNDPELFGIGARKISVSTAGVVPGIARYMNEDLQLNLSLSLHASNDKLRSELMPINKKYPLDKLLKTVREYIIETKRRVMIEYIMLDKINDSEKHAQELAELLNTRLKDLFFVNLIRYNETGKFAPSSNTAVSNFKKILESSGIEVVERFRFGTDISAACGQLATKDK